MMMNIDFEFFTDLGRGVPLEVLREANEAAATIDVIGTSGGEDSDSQHREKEDGTVDGTCRTA